MRTVCLRSYTVHRPIISSSKLNLSTPETSTQAILWLFVTKCWFLPTLWVAWIQEGAFYEYTSRNQCYAINLIIKGEFLWYYFALPPGTLNVLNILKKSISGTLLSTINLSLGIEEQPLRDVVKALSKQITELESLCKPKDKTEVLSTVSVLGKAVSQLSINLGLSPPLKSIETNINIKVNTNWVSATICAYLPLRPYNNIKVTRLSERQHFIQPFKC